MGIGYFIWLNSSGKPVFVLASGTKIAGKIARKMAWKIEQWKDHWDDYWEAGYIARNVTTILHRDADHHREVDQKR